MEKWIGDRISTFDHREYTSIVVFPYRKKWKEMLLFAWVMSYSIVGIYIFYILFFAMDKINNSGLEGDPNEILRNQRIYLSVFLAFWAYFEYKVVKGFLWITFGKELVKVDKEYLTIKNSIFSYGKAKSYFIDNIKNMNQIEQKEFSFGFDYENAFWRKGTDNIEFEYMGKKVSFAKKLNTKDANLLLRFINDRMKKLKKK